MRRLAEPSLDAGFGVRVLVRGSGGAPSELAVGAELPTAKAPPLTPPRPRNVPRAAFSTPTRLAAP